ncbi:hypothetical protein ACQCN2_05800 [Brevibacillus ginsengisoli]|uniref:hypothetical protein n=1 Tax=Brevibacillus ginsengisoli TaxID=363854 RepID=UPI003CF29D91
MEEMIESYIDNALDKIASPLIMSSIFFGVLLLTLGIACLVKRSSARILNPVGLVCTGFGTVVIISGLIQI